MIVLTSDVRVEKRVLHFVFENYVAAVERAGGLPLHVPPLDPARVPQVLEIAHGFVFVGGEDLDPHLYGEEPDAHYDPAPADRQAFDMALGRALLYTKHPVLGICYGCQLLTIVSGGARA
ncbi:MAG: C26 family cysteine hydrolase domain-containing family, partial [Gemmatimonadetes bacterium]|nr:C26 family cysteine hydrolase domain-containing family [Gemmatimonadota bacterium]